MSAFEEHRKIFGFRPNDYSRGRKCPRANAKSKKVLTYTKETICINLRTRHGSREQRKAKIGLGMKKNSV